MTAQVKVKVKVRVYSLLPYGYAQQASHVMRTQTFGKTIVATG
jgi:hypothetical protein